MNWLSPDSDNRRLRINLVFLCVAVILSLYFAQMRVALNLVYERATPELLVEGLAPNPYQLRILIPWLIRMLLKLPFVPLTARNNLFMGFEFLSLFLLVVAFRYYLLLLIKRPLLSAVLAFSVFYALPFNYLYTFWYPYDIPSLLFFTVGLILLYKQDWKLYYPLFILGTFNRETTLFLVGIYILTSFRKSSWRDIFRHTAIQVIIWFAIRLILIQVTGDGSRSFNWGVERNIETAFQPTALLWIPVSAGMTWLLAFLGFRRIKDEFVRHSLLIVIPWLIVMFFVGRLVELRIYGELIPVVLPAALLVLQSIFVSDLDPG